MANQTIAKPLGLIKDLKIIVHGILYAIIFTVIHNNVLDSTLCCKIVLGWKMLKCFRIGATTLSPYKELV
jgi:hypothetical protein